MNEILPFAATWIDLQGLVLSEISPRMINTVCYQLYVESENKTKEYDKAETDSQILRTNQWLPVWRGNREGKDKRRGLRGTNCYT